MVGRAVARENGLVADYEFNEGYGTVLHDVSGQGHHGRIHGATWAKVGVEYALRFDGQDDYVDCGEGQGFQKDGPFSLEAWIYPEELPNGEALLLGRDGGSYMLTYSGSAYPARVYLNIARVGKKGRARAPAGLWHHIVATFDGERLRVYVDGATAGGVRVWKHEPTPAGPRFRIGGGVTGLQHFKGMITAVRVYPRALSREEAFRSAVQGRKIREAMHAPVRPPFPKGTRVLNNLVAELLYLDKPRLAPPAEWTFSNPREGWVFVSATVSSAGKGRMRISLGNAPDGETLIVKEKPGPETLEAMRYCPAGQHRLTIEAGTGASLQRLIVRAIPELVYGGFPTEPIVGAYGTYSKEFIEKDVLPNINVLWGAPDQQTHAFLEVWKRQGRKYISEHAAAWFNDKTHKPTESADEMYQVLAEKPGLADPFFDGMILDTHDVSHSTAFEYYAEAVRRIRNSQSFTNKRLYFYCDSLYGARASESFAKAVLAQGYPLAWTRYLHEQPTTEMALEYIERSLADEAIAWQQRVPGSIERMIVVLGYLTSPGERMNLEPGANFRVFMDMQCNLLANHPGFAGLRGVMWYKSHYADEDAVRWAGRLFRHYFIEGRTEMLSKDPYELNHLENPDFERREQGWTLSPAEQGSLSPKFLDRYGFQQGRWLETGVGDYFLWTRRSAARPNKFSQEIRNLEPGRVYSLEMYTADYKDIIERKSVQQKHAVSITVENVDWMPEKCFQHVYSNWPYYHMGPYDDQESLVKTYINFHRRVFRATKPTARLTVSDWIQPDDPGGPVGQELMFNFIEVQPWLEFENVNDQRIN